MATPISYVRSVALAVRDTAAEREFLKVWGLHEAGAAGSATYHSAEGSADPYVIRLRDGEDRRVDLISFAAESREGVDALHGRLVEAGVRIVSAPHALTAPGGGYGSQFFDCDGRLIAIAADVAQRSLAAPTAKAALPQRISHVVLHTPDVPATVAWYQDVLGLKVSDWLDDFMCFMRGADSKHHIMAFLKGPPALNHIAFEMENTDAVMRGLGRMLKASVPLTWGPGRHTAGDNTFSYFSTPAGNIFEYTAEIEELPTDWTPRTFPRTPEIMDQWGTGRIGGPAAYPPLTPDPGLWQPDPLDS